MGDENDLEWEKTKKIDEDMINYGKIKALNDNKKTKSDDKESFVKKDTYINKTDNNSVDITDIYEDYSENIKTSKFGLISIIILAILLFIAGIFIGNKLLEIDEKPVSSYKVKEISKKSNDEEIISNKTTNETEDISLKLEEEDEEEIPIIYAQYKIKDPNSNNKDCSVSFGKSKNFSISLGKNNAYIYGEYHIDGTAITCNAITWRNSEKQEAINSTITFNIIEKNEVQISKVNIYDGNEGLDKELINLDGLRVGIEYVWNKAD